MREGPRRAPFRIDQQRRNVADFYSAAVAGFCSAVDSMLTNNLEKIAEHGKRADGIVTSMLEHSRGASGERRAVGLNNLVDEALNLAYHGARAQDQSFNISLERDFETLLRRLNSFRRTSPASA